MEYSKSDIVKTGEPDLLESKLLSDYDEGKFMPYAQCFSVLNNLSEVDELKSIFLQCAETNVILKSIFFKKDSNYTKYTLRSGDFAFSFKDLSELNQEDITQTMNQCILLAQKKRYVPNRSYLSYLQVFKFEPTIYFIHFSYCLELERFLNTDDLISLLLPRRTHSNVMDKITNLSRSKKACLNHYSSTLVGYPRFSSSALASANRNDYSESFALDEGLRDMMMALDAQNRFALKAACTTLWGVLFSKLFSKNKLIIGEELSAHRLSVVPYPVDLNEPIPTVYKKMELQFHSSEEFTSCSLSELEATLCVSLSDYIPLVQCFTKSFSDKLPYDSLKRGVLYSIDASEPSAFPMTVTYKLYGDSPYISYECDLSFFADISILSLHENFLKLLKGFLDKTVDPAVAQNIVERGNRINILRRHKTVAGYLSKQAVLSTCTEEDFIQLAEHLKVTHYSMDEPILPSGVFSDKLYLIANGKVAVEGTNSAGVDIPLLILKAGDLFGFECLSRDTMSKNSYIACSDGVIVLELSRAMTTELIAKRPAVALQMFGVLSDRLERFEKLWLMME